MGSQSEESAKAGAAHGAPDFGSGTSDSYSAYLKVMVSRGWVPYQLNIDLVRRFMHEQDKPPRVTAQIAGLNPNALTKILDRTTRFPSMRAIEGIAYALDSSVQDITQGGYFRQKGENDQST